MQSACPKNLYVGTFKWFQAVLPGQNNFLYLLASVHNDVDDTNTADDANDYNRVIGIALLKTFSCAKHDDTEVIFEHSIDETFSEESDEEDTSSSTLRRSTRGKICQRYGSYHSHRVSRRLYILFVLLTYNFTKLLLLVMITGT